MKRAATLLVLLICLALGAVRWVDLLNFCDLATGFAVQGEFWWRYAVMGGALLLFWLARFLAARRPVALLRRSPAMGACALVCGLVWAGVSGFTLASNLKEPDYMQLALCTLYALTALWFFLMAVSRLTRYIDAPSGSAWVGILGTVGFYLLTVYRFGFRPASISRVSVVVEVLSSLAALLFVSAAVRATYLPFTPCGRRLSFFGLTAFFFCACLEAPQSLCQWLAGYKETGELLLSLALGCTGLLGGLCALAAVGEEADQEGLAP